MAPRKSVCVLAILVSCTLAQLSTASSDSGHCYGAWLAWEDEFRANTEKDEAYTKELDALNHSLHASNLPLQKRVFEEKECPFGTLLLFDVTWPGPPTDQLAEHVEPSDILKKVAVIYGYVPFLPLGCVLGQFCCRRGTRQLWVLLWVMLLVLINEKIIKKLTLQPRPGALLELRGPHGRFEGSCAHSCGMPSSHSALAIGWFVLSFLDAAFRIVTEPVTRNDVEARSSEWWLKAKPPEGSILSEESEKASAFCAMFCVVPWVQQDVLTRTEFVAFVAFWAILMLPVPFMRVVLHDHSTNQAACGMLIGGILAIAWWRVVRVLQRRYQTLEGKKVCHGLLTHDYIFCPQQSVSDAGADRIELATRS